MWTLLAVQIAHLLNLCWLQCTIPKKGKRLLWKLKMHHWIQATNY